MKIYTINMTVIDDWKSFSATKKIISSSIDTAKKTAIEYFERILDASYIRIDSFEEKDLYDGMIV